MNYETVIIENVSKKEAYEVFNKYRGTITDTNKSTIVVSGNKDNDKEGWSVVKIYYNRFR